MGPKAKIAGESLLSHSGKPKQLIESPSFIETQRIIACHTTDSEQGRRLTIEQGLA